MTFLEKKIFAIPIFKIYMNNNIKFIKLINLIQLKFKINKYKILQ